MTETELYTFNTCDLTLAYSALVKLQNVGDFVEIKAPFYLVDHPEGTVLFDTGISHDLVNDPESYGQHGVPDDVAALMSVAEMSEADSPANQLEAAGFAPSEIDYVVMSHLHLDHAGNIDQFPDAEFIVHQDELAFAWWPTDPIQRDFYLEGDFAPLRTHDRYDVTAVVGRYDIFGDGSVVCLPTPGHTRGHQSLQVELENEGTVVLAGDVAALEDGYRTEVLQAYNREPEEAVRSVRKLRDIERTSDARIVILHDPDHFEAMPEPPAALD